MPNLIQVHNATASQPKLFPKFPAYFGGYCPHIFWHVSYQPTPRNTSNPYYHEAIFSASWLYKDQLWSKPKRQSVKDTTICILQINNETSPNKNLPHISSIYIDPLPNSQHLNHPTSLVIPPTIHSHLNTCLNNPTPNDIYNFAVNPNHEFSQEQKILISRRLIAFPGITSGSAEMAHINQLWDTFKYHRALPTADNSTPPPASHKSDPPLFPQFPEIKNLLALTTAKQEQIYGANLPTKETPYVVPDYPEKFGHCQYRVFWLETIPATSSRRHYQTAFTSFWDTTAAGWTRPTPASPPKSTVCVMAVDQDPLSPTYTLPLFSGVNLHDPRTNHKDV